MIKEHINLFKNNPQNLDELRIKLHCMLIILMMVHIVFITPYRYFYFSLLITKINIVEFSIYAFSLILYIKKLPSLSIYFSAFCIPILFATVTHWFKLPIASSLWFFLAFMIIYIILLRGVKIKIIFALFCFIIYFLPGIFLTYEFPGNLIKTVQIITLTLIPIIVSIFIERQDLKIIQLNKELRLKYDEKVKLAEELSEKNKDLITFSHIMSHDLKTPIRTINSFSKIIREKSQFEDKEIETYFKFIEKSSKSMENLINELLSYHRVDDKESNFEIVGLNEIIENIKSTYQLNIKEEKVKIENEYLPKIMGNKLQLNALFLNLISNSIKYQPKNNPKHIPSVKISDQSTAEMTVIEIVDNGIGINQKFMKDLFTPFKRDHNNSDYDGTGLGLSICKKIMDKHEAKISVKKSSNTGTTFELCFPKNYN